MRKRTLAAALAMVLGGVLAIAAPASAHPVLTITANPSTVAAGNNVTLTISGKSNGNYTGARIEVFSTGGPGVLTSFTTLVGCGGGATTCTEIPNRYRLGLPNLVNNQNFAYTVTFTIDAATAATTFTTKAQFYKSDNTTDGPTTGPVITVTHPLVADLAVQDFGHGSSGAQNFFLAIQSTNAGPDAVPATLTFTVNRPASFMTPTFGQVVVGSYTCNVIGQTIVCTMPSHAVGPPGGVRSEWTVGLLSLGSFTVTATISTTATDPNPANNAVSVTCNALTGAIISCP